MEYVTTKEECADKINGVCSRCGGDLEPIETVDNARNPTFWCGCVSCCCFDNGVQQHTYEIARRLVDNGYSAYSFHVSAHDDDDETKEHNRKQQVGGTCRVVNDVLRIHAELIHN